jgi:predicted RNA binding protein YcfA (HicA-like mRNA interferase family)
MSPKLPVLRGKEVIRALERAGFYIHHQTGSHARLFHRTRPDLRITIPVHSGDLPNSILKSIIRQAGMSNEEFLKLL